MLHADNLGGVIRDNHFKGDKGMKIGAFTDRGKTRKINEDNFFISDFNLESGNGYCIIADGMGGHNAGEVASKIAIEKMKNHIQERYSEDMEKSQIIAILKEMMQKANRSIYWQSLQNKTQAGMGTTAIFCLLHNSSMYIAHVGDSRVYLIRDNGMHQITVDHSIVAELVNSGSITREEAEHHPQKNVITRALGGEQDTQVDIYVQQLETGDIILICTDGLTNMVRDTEILSEMKKWDNLQITVEKLVRLANDKGGLDNITVVAVKI